MQRAQVTQGADLGGQYAAALAAASMLIQATDSAYAAKLLDAAKRSYEFAEASQGAKCAPCLLPLQAALCWPFQHAPARHIYRVFCWQNSAVPAYVAVSAVVAHLEEQRARMRQAPIAICWEQVHVRGRRAARGGVLWFHGHCGRPGVGRPVAAQGHPGPGLAGQGAPLSWCRCLSCLGRSG